MKTTAWFLGLGLAGTLTGLAAEKFAYVDLIQRLTNLTALAVLPAEGERCEQWSSYDRASQYNETTGKYEKWDANGDGGGFIRKEGDRFVFAEMKGPGCIWRIWSAKPEQGRVRIYLDGAGEPAVDLPFVGYFDGKNEPFTQSALVHTTASGWNNYTPIPYQKSCKIVAEKGWGAYYQFVYTTYPKGTEVPTFKRQLDDAEKAALNAANEALTNPGSLAKSDYKTLRQDFVLEPGKPIEGSFGGPAALYSIRAQIKLPGSARDRDILREITLQIRWDDEEQPSVWAPIGDFFGTAAGANAYRSFPSGLTEDGWWYCNWYMPYVKRAQVTLLNEGKESQQVTMELLKGPIEGDTNRLGRFHAKWHRDAFLPEEPERAIDWTMLKTEGRGRFLGVMLHVWNPKGNWWGEGDEKFFVDGEKFPSTIGTGSEDYFGYAWCNPALFQNAYHNQTISMGNKGHICVNRWHVADNIPFQKSFEAAIEKYFPNRRPTLYASTVYWYLAPDGKDAYPVLPLNQRVGYWTEITNFTVKGAIEGERLKILTKTAGNPHPQDLGSFSGDWSDATHLWWTGSKPGDRLELALPVKEAGKYKLSVAMTKARDYGIAQLYLDGKKLGEPIDFYDPEVVPTGPIALGEFDLTAGDHTLTLEITGANDKAAKAYMTGLDYVKLEPVP